MRISDWSSDVCSSDLLVQRHPGLHHRLACRDGREAAGEKRARPVGAGAEVVETVAPARQAVGRRVVWRLAKCGAVVHRCGLLLVLTGSCRSNRSEEHTSELQSLMRISYAVFCLKKKKK